MTQLFGSGSTVYDSDLGEFISEDHMRLARVLNDYKPTLRLVYIPKKDRTGFEKPWAICEKHAVYGDTILRYLSEEEMKKPSEILTWVALGDTDRSSAKAVLDRIEMEERMDTLLQQQRQLDEMDDMIDHLQFYASGGVNHKNYIRYDKNTTVSR